MGGKKHHKLVLLSSLPVKLSDYSTDFVLHLFGCFSSYDIASYRAWGRTLGDIVFKRREQLSYLFLRPEPFPTRLN